MSIELNGTTGITSPNLTGDGSGLTSLTSANLTGDLPAISGSSLTSLTSANLTGALPAIDGSALTGVGATSTNTYSIGSTTGMTLTGLPAGVMWVDIPFYDVWPPGSSREFSLRLGTSGGVKATGYDYYTKNYVSNASRNFSTQFEIKSGISAGLAQFRRVGADTDIWSVMAVGGHYNGIGDLGGYVNLGGELTQIQILLNGSGSFDSGNISFNYG